MSGAVPQTVEIVGQPEKQGLADLRGQTAAGRARGELAFDSREHAFDLGALPVRFFRKSAEHLIPDGTVRDTPAPCGDNAFRSQALPNMFVVGFGIKLRIREHHTDRSAAGRHIEQPRQSTCVAPPRLTSPLRLHKAYRENSRELIIWRELRAQDVAQIYPDSSVPER